MVLAEGWSDRWSFLQCGVMVRWKSNELAEECLRENYHIKKLERICGMMVDGVRF